MTPNPPRKGFSATWMLAFPPYDTDRVLLKSARVL
jgi:hypothetical protein